MRQVNKTFTIFGRNQYDPSSAQGLGDIASYDLPGLYIKASEACTSGWGQHQVACWQAILWSIVTVIVVDRVCTAGRERVING